MCRPQPCFTPVEVHAGGSLAGNDSSDASSTASLEKASSACTDSAELVGRVLSAGPGKARKQAFELLGSPAIHDRPRSMFDCMLMVMAPLATGFGAARRVPTR